MDRLNESLDESFNEQERYKHDLDDIFFVCSFLTQGNHIPSKKLLHINR